jgi:hypothetical protein
VSQAKVKIKLFKLSNNNNLGGFYLQGTGETLKGIVLTGERISRKGLRILTADC